MNINLLTINLHSYQEENQMEKFKIIGDFIIENHIDIVAFQEISQNRKSKILKESIREDNPAEIFKVYLMENGKNYDYFWDWSHYGFQVYEEGVAVLSRFPIVEVDSRYVSKSEKKDNWKSRKVVMTKLKISEKDKLNVFSCHMGWQNDTEEPFQAQMKKLHEFVKIQDEGSIIMGDFNNPSTGKGYELITDYGYVDLYLQCNEEDEKGFTIEKEIHGWEGNKNGIRIDYMFSDSPLKVLESKVVFKDNIVSDHMGIFTKIKV